MDLKEYLFFSILFTISFFFLAFFFWGTSLLAVLLFGAAGILSVLVAASFALAVLGLLLHERDNDRLFWLMCDTIGSGGKKGEKKNQK